jgi:hypothetical protein
MQAVRALQKLSIVRLMAWLYLAFALAVTVAGKFPQGSAIMPGFLVDALLPNDKENIAPYRILHLLALAFLFTYLVPANAITSPWLQPIMRCGQEWLAVFCSGVFLSFAGHFILITSRDSILVHVLVSLAGVAIMTAVAYYVSWSKRQDRRPAIRTVQIPGLSAHRRLAK